jgi:hypothetical protein
VDGCGIEYDQCSCFSCYVNIPDPQMDLNSKLYVF